MTAARDTYVRQLAAEADRLYRRAAIQHLAGDPREPESRAAAREALLAAGIARARLAAGRPVSEAQAAAGEAYARRRLEEQDEAVWTAVLRDERARGSSA